jgi:lycopene elongase/hydratase (dihydrobisanhydrobacterioruberin-forming)
MIEVRGPGAGAARARTLNRARRIGYRLLPGEGFSYLLHLRPREWPIMAGHTAFGYLLALAAGAPPAWGAAALGLALWVVFLNGGTLAINSAFDRDSGDIGYLDAPPPVPRHLFAFGMGLMLLGLAVALAVLPPAFALVYAICLAMSVLYSVPPFRWKAVAGMDLVINLIGFGTLTPVAGWALTQQPIPGWGWILLTGFGPLFAALYPLTQLYQFEEDRARGDWTLAIALGMRRSLLFAWAAMLLAFALFLWGLTLYGGARAVLPVLPALAAWALVLGRWYRRHEGMDDAQHKRGMYAALRAWALTDAAVLAAVFLV